MKINVYMKHGLKTKALGIEGENKVKEKLWRFGYSVEHQHTSAPFDLLVNGKIKVEVKSVDWKYNRKNKDKVFWKIMLPYMETKNRFYNSSYAKFDVLALCLFMPFMKPLIVFFDRKKIRRYKLFRNKYAVYLSTRKIKKLLEIGTTSPYPIFGNPKNNK